MNGIIHDMEIEMARGDSMINPKYRNADGSLRKFDVVVANPMWNQPFAQDAYEMIHSIVLVRQAVLPAVRLTGLGCSTRLRALMIAVALLWFSTPAP